MSKFDDLGLKMEVLEGVMCLACVCLHLKPLKLSPEMACRPIFYPFIPAETHTGSNGKVNMTPRPLYHVDADIFRPYKAKKL